MKILFIDVNYKNSSTGNIVSVLHNYCLNQGFESFACYGRGPKERHDTNVFKFGIGIETLFHAFLTRVTGYTGCFSYFSTLRLIKFIKKKRPDIVHIHELHAYFVNIKQLIRFLKKAEIKTVFTNHCEFLYTGKCGHSKDCLKYSDLCGECPHLHDYPKTLLFDKTKKMLIQKKQLFDDWGKCYFVSPSKWLEKKFSLSFLRDKPHKIIHNGIDTNFFNYNEKFDSSSCTTILSVAPDIMSSNKGGRLILELAERFVNEDIQFILIGSKTKLNNNQLPKNVSILPHISDKNELLKRYCSSDVFVIASANENYPTTCLEAQCCGLRIAGFDVGGISETIVNEYGHLVDYGNIDKLEIVVRSFLREKVDKNEISKESVKKHSLEMMCAQYLILYKELL